MKLLVGLLVIAAIPGSAKLGYELDFYAGKNVDSLPNLVRKGGESACGGEIVTVKILAIPATDSEIIADEINELLPDGRIARTWRVPLEADPVGVSQGTLFIVDKRRETKQTFGVDLDGGLHLSQSLPAPSQSAYSQCPSAHLSISGYRWCVSLTDGHSGKSRTIAFEGPCT